MKKYILCFFLFCFQYNAYAQYTDHFCGIYKLLATQEYLINFLPPNFNDYAKGCINKGKFFRHSSKLCSVYAGMALGMYEDYLMSRQLEMPQSEFLTYTEKQNVQTEIRLRNICMQGFADIHFNCIYYKCLEKHKKHSGWWPVFMDRNLTGEQICRFLNNINCLESEISAVKDFLLQAGTHMSDSFLFDMDAVIAEIRSETYVPKSYLSKVETAHPICFSVDKNGDTVWHVLAGKPISGRGDKFDEHMYYFPSWFDMCASMLDEEEKTFLYDAMFFKKNNENLTAIQIAYEHEYMYMFKQLGRYFERETISCCNLVDVIAQETQINQNYLSQLCRCN